MQISYKAYNSYHWSNYRCPNITKQNNETTQNAISEVSEGDCIIMGDFNHGNIKVGLYGIRLVRILCDATPAVMLSPPG